MARMLVLVSLLLAVSLPVEAVMRPPKVFEQSANQALPAPLADKAQIVFIEPINRARGILPVAIYELTDGKRKLVGVCGYESKTIVNLPPGRHTLMATQGLKIAHLMEANVEAGKRYYVMVRFIYTVGMQLRPLRATGSSDFRVDMPVFAEWQSETKLVEMMPDAADRIFTSEQIRKVNEAQAEALEEWHDRKTPEERTDLTLMPADAVAL